MKMYKVFSRIIIFSLLLNFGLLAQTKSSQQLDSLQVAAFMDSVIIPAIENHSVPGCGVVVVKDSSILFSKGYGYSDVENKIPIDPNKTLFRTASVCKVVTGTVVLMVRDDGLLDMNKDVNQYLTLFKVPQKFRKPITLKNLLTHTPGFDDIYVNKSTRSIKDAPKLGKYLKEYLPERVMPPGEIFCYSNLGNALAAFVVEEVTKKDFDQYATEHLFRPLEMNTSSYTYKDFQKQNLYKGYYQSDGQFVEFPFDHINDYPAGQMLSPLNEFAHFMIMQLNNGKYKGKQIVDSATVNEMQSTQFTQNPIFKRSSGYAFGLSNVNGYKNVAHGGGYEGISTLMFLFPELKVGIYTATNMLSQLPGEICYSFMNKFYPAKKSNDDENVRYPLADLPNYDKNVDRFAGEYRATRYSRNTITKIGVLAGMLGNDMPIWTNGDGMIMMYDLGGNSRRLIQIKPLVFKSIDDNYEMAFREDTQGNITHAFTTGSDSLEKISWYETLNFNRILFLVSVLFFISILITLFIYKIKYKNETSANFSKPLLKTSSYVAGTFVLYYLLFSLIMMFLINSPEGSIGFAYGMPWYFYIIQIIPFIAIFFIALLAWRLYSSIQKISRAKLGFTIAFIVLFMGIINVWFLNYWCLLGWKF